MKIKKTDAAGKVYARRQRALAEALKKRRLELGLSLSAVARSANVGYCSLWALETGRNGNVTLSLLMAYAEAVGMEVSLNAVKC